MIPEPRRPHVGDERGGLLWNGRSWIVPTFTAQERAHTEAQFRYAAGGEFTQAALATRALVEQARAEGYEAGLAAARREVNA